MRRNHSIVNDIRNTRQQQANKEREEESYGNLHDGGCRCVRRGVSTIPLVLRHGRRTIKQIQA